MLAMAVVNHKGGGGGLGRKCVEEEDDILTTLRRLRQTLQECHGRVGLMDQKVEALQPLYQKISNENDIDFRRNDFHTHSFEDYAMEDQCHTRPSKKPTNHMMNGMTNRMHGNVGKLALSNGGGLLLNYHEIMNKGNLYMNDLAQSPSQDPLSALELDLMSLAEKHAKELCDMYHSQSNATNGQNCKKLEQEQVTPNTENKKTCHPEEIPIEKNLKGGSLQIPNTNGDPSPSINGMKLPEEKNTRNFSKCKEWWSDRLSNMKKPDEDLYENGIETNGNEEESLQEIPNGEGNNKFCEQDYFKSYTASNQDIPKVCRRRRRMLVRTRSIDLEDLPEECEITDLLISENIDDRTKECRDDTLPVVNEMGIDRNTDFCEDTLPVVNEMDRITECREDESPVAHEMGMERTKECHDNTLPVLQEMEIDQTEEYCEDRVPNIHELRMDMITECCEDKLPVSHEMGMDSTKDCHDNALPVLHEMDRTEEYCEDKLPVSHEMGMDRTEECLEDTVPVLHEMDRTEECLEDTVPFVHETKLETSTDNEKILSEDKRLLTEIKICGETRSTEDAVNTSAKVSSIVPVYKIQSSLNVVEKSLDDFKKSISELHDNLKQMNNSEELAGNSCIVPILRNTIEDSENRLNPVEFHIKSSDMQCSENNAEISLCNRKWSYGNKSKGHSCNSKQKILGISDESQRLYKVRGRHNFVVKLSKQRGSEADTVHANTDRLIHQRQYKDSQGWLYKFITFVVFMMLLFFVFYILLTVPIITLSVKHNGRPVAF